MKREHLHLYVALGVVVLTVALALLLPQGIDALRQRARWGQWVDETVAVPVPAARQSDPLDRYRLAGAYLNGACHVVSQGAVPQEEALAVQHSQGGAAVAYFVHACADIAPLQGFDEAALQSLTAEKLLLIAPENTAIATTLYRLKLHDAAGHDLVLLCGADGVVYACALTGADGQDADAAAALFGAYHGLDVTLARPEEAHWRWDTHALYAALEKETLYLVCADGAYVGGQFTELS